MKILIFFFKYLKILLLMYFLKLNDMQSYAIQMESIENVKELIHNKTNDTYTVFADLDIITSKDIHVLNENFSSVMENLTYTETDEETTTTYSNLAENQTTDLMPITITADVQPETVIPTESMYNTTTVAILMDFKNESNMNAQTDTDKEIVVVQKLDTTFFSKFLRMFGSFNMVRPIFFTNININFPVNNTNDPSLLNGMQINDNEIVSYNDRNITFKEVNNLNLTNVTIGALEEEILNVESTINLTEINLMESFETQEYENATREVFIEKIIEQNRYES